MSGTFSSYTVELTGRLTLSSFERTLAACYQKSRKASEVVFDLTNLEWCGHLPTALFFAWAVTLREHKSSKRVTIRLSDRHDLTLQVHKALVEYGVLRALEAAGVEVPYSSYPEPRIGLPFTVVISRDDLWDTLQQSSERLLTVTKLPESAREVVKDAFEVVLFELAENAFVHTDGSRPHYQVTVATSSGPTSPWKGLMSVFEEGLSYIEISLGDLGPGIEYRLASDMNPEYVPPFGKSKKYLKAERVLAYAFEFGSTSDTEGRKARLEQLLAQDEFNLDEVATGLFCVLDVARSRRGQLIIRTPAGLLSLDFTDGKDLPAVRGRKELSISRLSSLKGTHYLLRLPLATSATKPKSISKSAPEAKIPHMEIVAAFESSRGQESIRDVLHSAIAAVEAHLHKTRERAGFSVIMPPRQPLPSRSLALFLGVLRVIPHGNRTLLWLEPRASTTVPKNIVTPEVPATRFRFGGQLVLLGDLVQKEFLLPGNPTTNLPRGLTCVDAERGQYILHPQLFDAIQEKYAVRLREELQELLRLPEVRHSPGPFLIEGQYYTDTFYEVARALEAPSHVRMFADWFLRQLTGSSSGEPPEVLISTAVTVSPVLHDLADLMQRFFGQRPHVLEPTDPASPIWAMGQLIPHSDKHVVVITDVICRGQQIEEFLLGTTGVKIDRILAFVDARDSHKIGQSIIANPARPTSIPVHAVLEETIISHEQPTSGHEQPTSREDIIDPILEAQEEERVYVIDRRTHAPTLYTRSYKPKLSFVDLIDNIVPESGGLFYGHLESDRKHYSVLLDFPRLFSALKERITEWISEQVNYIEHTSQREDTSYGGQEPWHSLIYNPDQSLSWLQEQLPKLRQHPSVRFVTRAQLHAPPQPQEKDRNIRGHWLVVLPAIASGETARRCIEFASRYAPRSILVLCVVSRMEPRHLSFMIQITKYRTAVLRFARFLELSLGACDPGEGTCPSCAEIAELTRLHNQIQEECGEGSELAKALGEKIAANGAVMVEREESGMVVLPPPSRGDLGRSRLRALYEASNLDIGGARRTLNSLLSESKDQIDLFLAIMASERRRQDFSLDELKRRLYKTEEDVRNRAHEILAHERPPFPIGRMVGALIHLRPGTFMESATELISHYAHSIRDVEEICVGLLSIRTNPPGSGMLLGNLRNNGVSA